MKRYIYLAVSVCLIFLVGCSDDSEPNFIITVEPRHFDLNDVPPYITITVENMSNMEWAIPDEITIERYDGNRWTAVFYPSPYGFGRRFQVTYPNESVVFTIPTSPSSDNYRYFDASVAGRYRAILWSDLEWYAEFTISDGGDDADY